MLCMGSFNQSMGVNMRKIEQEMIHAIKMRKNLNKGNMSVSYEGEGNDTKAKIFLHGNHIANYFYTKPLEVNLSTLARWPTPTTKSRLRALGAHVTTKKGQTFLDGIAV